MEFNSEVDFFEPSGVSYATGPFRTDTIGVTPASGAVLGYNEDSQCWVPTSGSFASYAIIVASTLITTFGWFDIPWDGIINQDTETFERITTSGIIIKKPGIYEFDIGIGFFRLAAAISNVLEAQIVSDGLGNSVTKGRTTVMADTTLSTHSVQVNKKYITTYSEAGAVVGVQASINQGTLNTYLIEAGSTFTITKRR